MTVKTKVEEEVEAILEAEDANLADTVEILDAPPAEVPARELETSKPLKLSEAMRLGSMTTTQVIGKLGHVDGGTGTACGIGAVLAGLGYGFAGTSWGEVLSKNPELKALTVPVSGAKIAGCGCNFGGRTVVDAIIHLNDDHEMPRNKIADRLESLGL